MRKIKYNYLQGFPSKYTQKRKKVRKYKSSPNLEYTCKTEVSTTVCNPVYSSTWIANKHEKNN